MSAPPDTIVQAAGGERAEALSRSGEGEGDALVARVIWHYYIGHQTQQQIADRLGLTRLRVNRIIGQARTDGSVQVEIRLKLRDCVALEQALIARYGLADAAVVPSIEPYAEVQRVVGEAASRMLEPHLDADVPVGVGWGRTLHECVIRLRPRHLARAEVVSLMGGLTRGSGTNTFEVSTRLAELLGAECYYLAAPIYSPSAEVRGALLEHYGLADVMRRAAGVGVALLSCGDLTTNSLLARTPSVQDRSGQLAQAGAVGDLLGTFLDAAGRPVAHPLNQQVIALSPDALRHVPVSILASGGRNKAPVIGGILAAGYVNRVVTDEDCARAILAAPAEGL